MTDIVWPSWDEIVAKGDAGPIVVLVFAIVCILVFLVIGGERI